MQNFISSRYNDEQTHNQLPRHLIYGLTWALNHNDQHFHNGSSLPPSNSTAVSVSTCAKTAEGHQGGINVYAGDRLTPRSYPLHHKKAFINNCNASFHSYWTPRRISGNHLFICFTQFWRIDLVNSILINLFYNLSLFVIICKYYKNTLLTLLSSNPDSFGCQILKGIFHQKTLGEVPIGHTLLSIIISRYFCVCLVNNSSHKQSD